MTVDDDRPGTKPTRARVPVELNARRTAAAAVLGDYKAAMASAPVSKPPGLEWMFRVASVLEDLLAALDGVATPGSPARSQVDKRAFGPFDTEADARSCSAAQAVYAVFDAAPGAGAMEVPNHRMLEEACEVARVGLGAYDRRILRWLANWEPTTCTVVAGLITRACEGGAVVAEDMRRLDSIRTLLARFDWEHHDRQLALEAIDRIVDPRWDGAR